LSFCVFHSGELGPDGLPGISGGDVKGEKGQPGRPGSKGFDGQPGVKGTTGKLHANSLVYSRTFCNLPNSVPVLSDELLLCT